MDNENNNIEKIIETDKNLARTYERRRRIVWGCAFAVLALVVAYMVWCAVHKTGMGITYVILLCGALAVFWLLTDVVSPIVVHAFDGRSQRQKNAYYKYAAFELLGYGGLAYFGISAMNRGTSIYGALVFLLATIYKRRFLDEYVCDKEDEEEEPEEAENIDGTEQPQPEPKRGAARVSQLSAADRLARLQASVSDDDEEQTDAETEAAAEKEPAEDTENTEDDKQ